MQEEDSEDDDTFRGTGISDKMADELYAEAGTRLRESVIETLIQGDDFPNDNTLVRSIVHAANLPFTLDSFQHSSLCALASNKSVILSAPCGSGKFLIISLATDVLRIKQRKPKGVAVVILPLTAIMREAQKNNQDVCYITMDGDVIGGDGENVTISDTQEAILSGKYKMILGGCVKIDIFLLSYIFHIHIFKLKSRVCHD